MSAPNAAEVHVTCPDAETATRIGRSLVERGLAACANVGGPLRSIYRWNGEIACDEEWSLTVKTRLDLAEDAAALIRAEHPYDLPAVVVQAIRADADTAGWIASATEDQPSGTV